MNGDIWELIGDNECNLIKLQWKQVKIYYVLADTKHLQQLGQLLQLPEIFDGENKAAQIPYYHCI